MQLVTVTQFTFTQFILKYMFFALYFLVHWIPFTCAYLRKNISGSVNFLSASTTSVCKKVFLTGAGKKICNRSVKKTEGKRRSRVPDGFLKSEIAKFAVNIRSVMAFLHADEAECV